MGRHARKGETPRGWKQWSKEEATTALAELARSGMSPAAFARSKGISTQRLRYWESRVVAPPSTAMSFVAVALPERAHAATTRGEIEIDCDGVVLRVREGLDVQHLARLTVALGRARRC